MCSSDLNLACTGSGGVGFSQVCSRLVSVIRIGRTADWPKFENTVYVASLLYFTSGTAGMVQAGYAPIKINETALLVGNYSNAAGVKVVTQATAGQSVDIVQVKNSGGTVIASIGPNGEGYFPNVGYVLFNHYADAGNTTTTETDLYSDTVAAGKLAVNGAKIDAKYGGVNVNSTSTKQLRVYFGGTMIFDTGALTISAASSWELEVLAIRVSASVVRCSCKLNLTGASTGSFANYVEVTGLTLTNSQVIKITGQAAGVGAATNDIVAKLGAAIFYAS